MAREMYNKGAFYSPLTEKQCDSLYRFLEHGNWEHREWLKEAIFCWNNDLPRPECDH